MKDDKLYLIHILERIRRIESCTKEGKPSFVLSETLQDAVIRNFEVIGEAAKRLSLAFREAHTDVPWRKVGGFRDVLIHDYLHVNVEEVWRIATEDLPGLKQQIEKILASLP